MIEMKIEIYDLRALAMEVRESSAWFNCPVNPDNVKDVLGLSDLEPLSYGFGEYLLPFDLPEDCTIEELNRLCNIVNSLEYPVCLAIRPLLKYYGTLDNLKDNQDTIRYYSGCSDMEEVAKVIFDEGEFDLPEDFDSFIDFNKYGAYLLNTRKFVLSSVGIFECYI